ncbi:hypothetical protein V6B33_00975 [Mangrovibacillus sp. Mu-81]|jgi:PAS domain-containing protein|uniref:hypothetical protein n=1 Tax=Mangrovibacillus sp. Mu-81 TaxID=3121478 RepID=UPI002FE453BF
MEPFWISQHPICPVNDERILAVGIYKDFTEYMRIQKSLEESEYCFRTLVEYLPESIIKQRNGKCEFANSSAVKPFGKETVKEILICSNSYFIAGRN